LSTETNYAITLNDSNSVPLKSTPRIYLVAGQIITIHEWHPEVPNERYRVQMLSYVYGFTMRMDAKEVELLTFQWNREPDPSNDYPLGHLHIGPGLLSKTAPIRPKDFHKAHIPTERLSFEAIVRFAIVELGVKPDNKHWQTTLEASELAFKEHKTI
jgi:hypothetical protein